MEILNVNLVTFTGNALVLIDIENIEGAQALNTSQAVEVRMGGITIGQISVSQFAGGNVMCGTGISLLFGFWGKEPFHVVIVLSSIGFLDTFEPIDVKKFARNASYSIVVRTGGDGTVLVVSCGFVFFQDTCSLFQDFGQVFGNPFGILKNGQFVFDYFLAVLCVHIELKSCFTFFANVP